MVGVKHTSKSDGDNVDATLWNTAHNVEGVASAYKSAAAQTITTATNTKVVLDAEVADPDSVFDTTNSRYLPGVAGYYFASGSLEYTDLNDADLAISMLWVTGVEKLTVKNVTGKAATGTSSHVCGLVHLSATDYIELYTYHDKGANATVNNDVNTTFLTVFPVSVD